MCTRPLSEGGTTGGDPRDGAGGLLSLELVLYPFQQLDVPPGCAPTPAAPSPGPAGFLPLAAAALEPGSSPNLALDLVLPRSLSKDLHHL